MSRRIITSSMKRRALILLGVCLAFGTPLPAQTPDFDTEYARLQTGPAYQRETPGFRELRTTVGGHVVDNTLFVPDDYDPRKPWPLRVQLHGGVSRPYPLRGEPTRPLTTNRIPSGGELILQPRAWGGSEWWRGHQVDNILTLVEQVKRSFNVDESRVYITGISDGGTGAYYLAMRVPTLWSSCIPLNGHPSVLANPDTGVEGQLFIGNLVNCPMLLVNGGRDPLYPAASVAPFVDMMKRAGVAITWHVYPEAGHDTSWWPDERGQYAAFVRTHPRAAHPHTLSWETERTDRYNRIRWLVIDTLGGRASDATLEDVNTFEVGSGRRIALYGREKTSGRVDVVRRGNAFEARARGVRELTLLLSPDVVDFSKPVKITVNGRIIFEGAVKKDLATLRKWAAKDNDRTMLYGAEVKIAVP